MEVTAVPATDLHLPAVLDEATDGSRSWAGTETPFLVMDLDVVTTRLDQLRAALPAVEVLYAVKANPALDVIAALARRGTQFDVASPGEIDLCLGLGLSPDGLSYGNTIKKERDIAYAVDRGVTRFTVDSAAELQKVVRRLTSGTVSIRVATNGAGADWPLSRKFGCSPTEAWPLMCRAASAGLDVGLAFHVGSQQRDPAAWDKPLAEVAALAEQFGARGHRLATVNLGGGLPASYVDPIPDIGGYGSAIAESIARHLGREFAGRLLIEPGRFLVGDAGTIHSEVVLVTDRDDDSGRRWVFLDVGRFNGLIETMGEAIRYRVSTERDGSAVGPVVLAGPSCDSVDVLYEAHEYQLPLALQAGDRVALHATGAYTASYSSVGFNGFPPLRCFFRHTAEVAAHPSGSS